MLVVRNDVDVHPVDVPPPKVVRKVLVHCPLALRGKEKGGGHTLVEYCIKVCCIIQFLTPTLRHKFKGR